MKKALTAALIGLSLTQLVSGCAALAVGGIAAGGMSALDRRSTGAQADDQMMELQISNTVIWSSACAPVLRRSKADMPPAAMPPTAKAAQPLTNCVKLKPINAAVNAFFMQ